MRQKQSRKGLETRRNGPSAVEREEPLLTTCGTKLMSRGRLKKKEPSRLTMNSQNYSSRSSKERGGPLLKRRQLLSTIRRWRP